MASYIVHTYVWTMKGLYGYYGLYFTNWMTTLNLISYTFSTALVITRFIQKRFSGHDSPTRRHFFEANHISIMLSWALATTSNSMSLIVALVYWAFLHEYNPNETSLETFVNYDYHLFIAMISILDVIVSARPWRFAHVYLLVVLAFLNIFLQLIYVLGFNGKNYDHDEPNKELDYIYPVFDWKSTPGKAIGYLIAMVVCGLLIHGLCCILASTRDKLWKKCFSLDKDVSPPFVRTPYPSIEMKRKEYIF